MPFVKGQSGNPGGKGTDKQWRDAVRKAVHTLHGDVGAPFNNKTKIIDVLAHKLVTKGLEGEIPAIREIGDRLDGKPAQALEHSGAIAHLSHEEWIERLK